MIPFNNEDDFNQYSKQSRREKLKHKKKNRSEVSDHHKHNHETKRQLRSKKESLYENELWEDWEEYDGL